MAKSKILKSEAADSQKLASIQQAILRRLQDDDLSVVQAALSLDGLTRVISMPDLLEALRDILRRCAEITSVTLVPSEASLVARSCLECAVLNFKDISLSCDLISSAQEKKPEPSSTEINMKTIGAFGETFAAQPIEYLAWLRYISICFS